MYRTGKRRSNSHFTVFFRANQLPESRFGFSIKKALGGAVVRIASGGGCERLCAVIARRYLQDGTSSFTRRSRSSGPRLRL